MICLLFVQYSYLRTVLFLDDLLLTVAVGDKFTSSSSIRISKTLESVLAFFEVECSYSMVDFELSGVDFVLTPLLR